MRECRTTICVVPRDKFVHAAASLRSILATLRPADRLVYVDAGSPEPVRAELARLAVEHDFTLLRTDHYLAPNEARNFAFGHVDSEFVLFVDNDVFVPEGWVERLEAAADERGAAAVAPVYGIAYGNLDRPLVHHAGAYNRVLEQDGTRVHDTTPFVPDHHADSASVLPGLVPRETEQVEFHCFLVRTDALVAVGLFDENMMAVQEHLDFSLQIREQGGAIWLEPSVFVTYLVTSATGPDRSYHILRWSRAWTETSLRRFSTRWDLDPNRPDAAALRRFTTANRAKNYRPYRSVIGRLSVPRGRLSRSLPDRIVEPLVVRREERRRTLGSPARVAHRATWDR